LLFGAALWAHHSTAPFDMTKSTTVSGVVTEFRWANPHSYILMDVGDEHWVIEAEALNLLRRNGWTKDTLQAGDRITCSGARAKDPSVFAMKCFTVVLPDGRKLAATPTSVSAPPSKFVR
jgi:hypothetical protein